MANSGSSAGLALASQRHLFEIPDDVAFLNCAYISPLPKVSLSAGDRGLRRKAQPWTIAANDFFTSSETVRKLFADLINADADDVAFAPAVSYGMAQAADNIPIRRTARIASGRCKNSFHQTFIRGWIWPSEPEPLSSRSRAPATTT